MNGKNKCKKDKEDRILIGSFGEKKVTFEGGFKYEDRTLQVTRWVARGEFSRVEHISISRAIGAGK